MPAINQGCLGGEYYFVHMDIMFGSLYDIDKRIWISSVFVKYMQITFASLLS